MRVSSGFLLAFLWLAPHVGAQTEVQITRYPLPDEVTYPEGIALDLKGSAFYTASAETGAVVRVPLNGGPSVIVAPAKSVLPTEPFPAALGITYDATGRLWLTGGRTGRMAVIDTASGKVLKRFETPKPEASLINDAVVVGGHVYFTDTFVPTLWRVAVKGAEIGNLEPWLEFGQTPLEYASGANLNGIAATSNGRHLLVVQMNKGLLFRIDVATKQVNAINVGNEPLTGGDGLVLDGRTLYVIRQTEEEIVTLDMAVDMGSGRVVNRFKNPALAWPATAAKFGDRLLVVNSQFNRREGNKAARPFEIVSIPLSALSGKTGK